MDTKKAWVCDFRTGAEGGYDEKIGFGDHPAFDTVASGRQEARAHDVKICFAVWVVDRRHRGGVHRGRSGKKRQYGCCHPAR